MKEVSAKEFRSQVRGGGRLVALFGMPGCGPCKIMKARMSGMNYGVPFVYLDAQQDVKPFEYYGVRSAPTLLAFENGEVVDRLVGPHTTQNILNWIDASFEGK